MYRRTAKYAQHHKRRERQELPEAEQRPAVWQPPHLRRRIVIQDFDGTAPTEHVIELYRTNRIDSYRAVIDGQPWKARIGWSRVLDGLRRAMPRHAAHDQHKKPPSMKAPWWPTKFAWWPVRLSECRDRTWHYTGRRAWLRRVTVVKTVWGETFYIP
ncbi:MAG: hypothetical protein L0H83_14540 [Salinisphaera sp.]|nr:hypothetical protein [Salinisphaera sp.]